MPDQELPRTWEQRWFEARVAVKLWLIRRGLRRCPACHGARMVHHFGGGPTATLTRCWTCTGSNAYLADTSIPSAQLRGDAPITDEHTLPDLHAV